MVSPWAVGGVMAGADILGGLFQQGQARKEQDRMRDFWRSQMRQRRTGEIGQSLKNIYQEQLGQLEKMPGYLKRSMEGRLSSAQSERRNRFQRNLARSGATRASSVGMMGEQQVEESLDRMGREGELQREQAMFGLRGQTAGLGQNLLNAFYPTPGQAAPGIAQSQESIYYNPMSALKSGMFGGMLAKEFNA